MNKTLSILSGMIFGMSLPVAGASDAVKGDRHAYTSPGGIAETCVTLARMPGGVYSEEDKAAEQALCSIDIYDANVAVCPKLRSTSPGTFVYQIGKGPYAGAQKRFEAEVCPRGDVIVEEADGPPAGFKVTMNAKNTSGTFSTASLLYYHFARYLDASVHVPVSVYRSIDRKAHEQRVTARGLACPRSKKSPADESRRLAGTGHRGEEARGLRGNRTRLFTADRSRIYGVLLHVNGKRYGPEFNGTRKSGWGEGQNRDFQETAPFLALRSDKPLKEAIAEGLSKASRDPALKKAMRHGVSPQQMAFWMQDLTEITLLDFIFSQQDRIGNIDYVDYWHWSENGSWEKEGHRRQVRRRTSPVSNRSGSSAPS